MNKLIVVAMVAACTTEVQPNEDNDPTDNLVVVEPEQRVSCPSCGTSVLGEAVGVVAEYRGLCEEPDENPFDDDFYACGVDFHVTLECVGAPCAIGATTAQQLSLVTSVTPLEPGPLEIVVRMTATADPTDVYEWRTPAFQAWTPDRLEARCNGGPCEGTFPQSPGVCFHLVAGEHDVRSREPVTLDGDTALDAYNCVRPVAGHHEMTARWGDFETQIAIDVTPPPST
jgi:hypothetical protein